MRYWRWPEMVEAVQFSGDYGGSVDDLLRFVGWESDAAKAEPTHEVELLSGHATVLEIAPSGPLGDVPSLLLRAGDWIVMRPNGTFAVLSDRYFRELYEPEGRSRMTKEGFLGVLGGILALLGLWAFGVVWTATWPVVGIAHPRAAVQGILLWGPFIAALSLAGLGFLFVSVVGEMKVAYRSLPTRREKRMRSESRPRRRAGGDD